MKNKILYGFLILTLVFSFRYSSAQEKSEEPHKETTREMPKESSSVTKHNVKIEGRPLNYTVTAGTYLLKEDDGKPLASIFYMAYMKDGVKDKSRRPLLFSFNGGPGTASLWLHLGVLGPRKVVYDDEGFALQPPYRLEDNEYSILDMADVVFIDPVAIDAPGDVRDAVEASFEDILAL